MIAWNEHGFGERSAVAVLKTESLLGAPTRLQAVVNDDVAVCSWEGPECPPGSRLVYHLETSESADGSSAFVEVYSGVETEFALNLKQTRACKFRVRAVPSSAADESTVSSPWSVTKGLGRTSQSLGVPEGCRAVTSDNGRSVTFSWNPPNGQIATCYQTRVDLQEGKKRRDVDGFTVVRDDLAPGVHRFQVRGNPKPYTLESRH